MHSRPGLRFPFSLRIVFIYLFLAVLGLLSLCRLFSSFREGGPLSSCGVWSAHCGGVSCCGAEAAGAQASVGAAPISSEHRPRSCGA